MLPSEIINVRCCLGLFTLIVPTFLTYIVVLFFCYSCVCFFLLSHSCCSHARGTLCGMHTPCMGSLFPIVHAEWSHVSWSFRIMLCCAEKDSFKLNNDNNLIQTFYTIGLYLFLLCPTANVLHFFAELPETSFTRSISNPEAVMRRRRAQKLEKKLQQFRSKDGGPDTGGTLKVLF